MQVPFVDLRRDSAGVWDEVVGAVRSALDGGRYILGPEVQAFESEFARFCEVSHAVGVASGTDALLLACLAAGLGEGDRVLVPANTFIATFDAVARCGAVPVPVDPHPALYTLQAEAVEAALDGDIRAVIPVHLYGQFADIEAIAAKCAERDLILIEDAAQAHGARFNGKRAGSFSLAGCFSFYPSKNLGALGDGGALVTSDAGMDGAVRMLRDYGQARKNEHLKIGLNSRLDEVQAAALRVKLRVLDANNYRRARAADLYREGLESVEEVVTPAVRDGSDHVYHLFVIRCQDRDALRSHLAERGIASGTHYPLPAHLQPAYACLGYGRGDFPVTERLCEEILSLPMFPSITPGEIEYVCDSIASFYGRGGA